MGNFLYWCSLNGVSSGGNYSSGGGSSSNKKQLCFTCGGTGRCKLCSGLGKTSNPYTGTRSVCTGCEGTGKCWHCYGSGIQ